MKAMRVFVSAVLLLLTLAFSASVYAQGTVIYSEDFESDDGGYTHAGATVDEWEWGTPTLLTGPSAHSGVNVWGTDLADSADDNHDGLLTSPAIPIPVLGPNQVARVRFFAWINVNSFWQDRGEFQVSSDGVNFKVLAELFWTMYGTWCEYQFDVSAYAGGDIYLRFPLYVFYDWGMPGFYIDDVDITIHCQPATRNITLQLEAWEDPAALASCPWVYTWNGSEYVADNDVYSTARGAGREYTDYYALQQPLVEKEGVYSLELREDGAEQSFTDMVQLIVVDHPSSVQIGTDESGNLRTYAGPSVPVSAVQNGSDNVTAGVTAEDGAGASVYHEDVIIVDFGALDVSAGAIFVLRAIGFQVDDENDWGDNTFQQPTLQIQTINGIGEWETRNTFYPRDNWATGCYDLAGLLPDSEGDVKVRIYVTSCHTKKYHIVDYVALDGDPQVPVTVTALPPATALHSEGMDVRSDLENADGVYAEMLPNQNISLTFPVPVSSGEQRDFVFVSKGYYLPITTGGTFFIYIWNGEAWVMVDGYTFDNSLRGPPIVDEWHNFDLSLFLPDGDGEFKVRIWQDYLFFRAGIDFAGLLQNGVPGTMVSAYDFAYGVDVMDSVLVSDDQRANWYGNSGRRTVEIRWTGMSTPAVAWGDTCMDHVGEDDPEDYMIGSSLPDQDLYAVSFYNPKGEAKLASISFQWYDPGSIDLWIYQGCEESCSPCEPLGPGESPFSKMLGKIGAGDFIGNWEWERVELEQCIQIPAKSCFFVVWKMLDGADRPRILGDVGHSESSSWIYNGEKKEWKCFPGYEYMVKVCLEYKAGCIEIQEPDITWSHPYRGEYPCVCDDYTVYARFHNDCDEVQAVAVLYWEIPWGLFTVPPIGVGPHCVNQIFVPPMGTALDSCACEFHHHPDNHNWWARNIGIAWDRDVYFCDEPEASELYLSRRCRMTIWPDGPWDKEPVKWGLAPITIPVWNWRDEAMRFELHVADLPESWRADLSWTDETLAPMDRRDVYLTVWPGGEEPEGPVVIRVMAFKCNGEWGEVEIEFMPYPEHFYLGPDGRPVQPVHVENIRWSPRYPCRDSFFDVWVDVVNDGPNSAYPKISFGLAEWGFFFPVFEEWGDTYKPAVFDTVLWGGIGGFARQVVAPYHYQVPWFEYEDLGCNYYQRYQRNIVIDYPVIRRHCLTPERDEFDVWTGRWEWTAEDSTTEYLRDCEMWFWPKHRWVDAEHPWAPVVFPIPVYNEEPYYDNIDLWIDENAFPPHIPPGWDYAFDVSDFDLLPGESAVANLSVVPQGPLPPISLPAHVIVHAAKGFCKRDTDYVDIKFLPFTGMCIRDTSGIKVGYKYSETCRGLDPTLLPGDQVGIGLMLDNEYPVSAAQIDLWYESAYMRVVDVQTT
ncbi:MAG: hypothetical protein JSV84_02600, partial [Gemmatimonadota bacterium]